MIGMPPDVMRNMEANIRQDHANRCSGQMQQSSHYDAREWFAWRYICPLCDEGVYVQQSRRRGQTQYNYVKRVTAEETRALRQHAVDLKNRRNVTEKF